MPETFPTADKVCPYCSTSIEQPELHSCQECSTPHHTDCWNANEGCTVYGCKAAPSDGPTIPIIIAAPPAPPALYFISRNGVREGPYYEPELRRRISIGLIDSNDYAWNTGMSDWIRIAELIH